MPAQSRTKPVPGRLGRHRLIIDEAGERPAPDSPDRKIPAPATRPDAGRPGSSAEPLCPAPPAPDSEREFTRDPSGMKDGPPKQIKRL
jgi:hypothetical protein